MQQSVIGRESLKVLAVKFMHTSCSPAEPDISFAVLKDTRDEVFR